MHSLLPGVTQQLLLKLAIRGPWGPQQSQISLQVAPLTWNILDFMVALLFSESLAAKQTSCIHYRIPMSRSNSSSYRYLLNPCSAQESQW